MSQNGSGNEGAVAGDPNQIPEAAVFDVDITCTVDRQGLVELAEMMEKTGNKDLLISARRIRNMLGAPVPGRVQQALNRTWKVKHSLIVAACVAGGVTANELFGRWRQRNGKNWLTFGNYRSDAKVLPLRRVATR